MCISFRCYCSLSLNDLVIYISVLCQRIVYRLPIKIIAYILINVDIQCTHMFTCTHTHLYTYTNTHTHKLTHLYTHTHTHAALHHTYTQNVSSSPSLVNTSLESYRNTFCVEIWTIRVLHSKYLDWFDHIPYTLSSASPYCSRSTCILPWTNIGQISGIDCNNNDIYIISNILICRLKGFCDVKPDQREQYVFQVAILSWRQTSIYPYGCVLRYAIGGRGYAGGLKVINYRLHTESYPPVFYKPDFG